MSTVNANRMITDEIFDSAGELTKAFRKRCARDRRRKAIRSWRPRVRLTVRVALFPKTQRRLAAMELELTRATNRLDWLQKKLAEVEGKNAGA